MGKAHSGRYYAPAHAMMTGLCEMDEIAGSWTLEPGDLEIDIILAVDGTGAQGAASTI